MLNFRHLSFLILSSSPSSSSSPPWRFLYLEIGRYIYIYRPISGGKNFVHVPNTNQNLFRNIFYKSIYLPIGQSGNGINIKVPLVWTRKVYRAAMHKVYIYSKVLRFLLIILFSLTTKNLKGPTGCSLNIVFFP